MGGIDLRGLIVGNEKGDALRSLTQGRPLSLLSLANRCLLEYQLSFLWAAGVREVMVVAAEDGWPRMAEVLEKWKGLAHRFLDPRGDNLSGELTPHLNSTVVVLLGPLITNIDLGRALSFHRERGSRATLFLHALSQDRHRSLVLTDGWGRVIKVLPGAPVEGEMARTAGSLYILEPEAAEHLIPRLIKGREEGVCLHLLKRDIPVYGFPVEGYWQQVEDLTAYYRVHQDIMWGRAQLRPAGVETSPGIWLGRGVEINAGVELVPPVVLGAGVQLGEGTRVGGSVLGPGTIVDGETVVKNSLLLANCYLGRKVVVEGAIVGEDTIVAGGTILRPGMLLAPQSVVSRDSLLGGAFELPPL